MFNKIIILGLGLIGGSVAKSCRKYGCSKSVSAYDIDSKQLSLAITHNIIDEIYNFDQKLSDNDLVIIAVPLAGYESVVKMVAPVLGNNTVIIDIGSVKFFVEQNIMPIFGTKAKNFVLCHPIAGSEKSGVKNADADLFLGKELIISTANITNKAAIDKIHLFWEKIGCRIKLMSAQEHDKIFALMSHIPQLFSLMAKEQKNIKINLPILKQHCRLENSNRQIWQDIFALNKDNINHYLQLCLQNLSLIKKGLEQEDYQQIIAIFKKCQNIVDQLHFKPVKQIEKLSVENQKFILKRIILLCCFINLDDIVKFEIHGGSGFIDFIAVFAYLGLFIDNQKLSCKLLFENKEYLVNFLKNLEIKIIHELK